MRSIAAPEASPLTADLRGDYPFEQIQGREDEERELRGWLLAGASGQRAGGAALVTGFRGVGKTSLINKVLFDVGLASLYGVELDAGDPTWGPFDANAKAKLGKPRGKKPGTLLVPIAVDIARPISAEALLHRVVRRVYFSLVGHGVGALDPRVVRRARAAYLRSLGESSVEVTERVKTALGMDTKTLSKLTLDIEMEAEFAETIQQVVSKLSVEEAEDEILDTFAAAATGPLGARTHWADLKSLGRTPVRKLLAEMAKAWRDKPGTRVHPVIVFDELDKLEPPDTSPRILGRVDGTWGISLDGHQSLPVPTLLSGKLSTDAPPSRSIGTAGDVVRLLKILFSSRDVSAIAVGGWALEDEWLGEQAKPDPLLRSIFSRHVYVRAACPDNLTGIVGDRLGERTSEYVALRTRGRYKDAIRVAHELKRDHHGALYKRLEPYLVDWGTLDADKLNTSSPVEQLENATTFEHLVRGVSAGLPPLRANGFGVDYVRAVIAGHVLEYSAWGIVDRRDTIASEHARAHEDRIPPRLLEQALRKLLDWHSDQPPREGGPA